MSVLSVVGKDFLKNNYLKLFKSHKPTFNLFKIQNINTLLKERYVNKISLNKTFEVYKNFPFNINQVIRKKLLKYLRKNINNFDLVIVSDYGHGLFNDEMMSLIEKKSKFLSVNAQTNAGNRGFNLITKYKKADYYCVDLPEARLALSDQDSSLVEIITKLSKKLRSKNLIISLGKDGCIIYNNKDKISQYPAFNVRPVDTMGAGDAFLCISFVIKLFKG